MSADALTIIVAFGVPLAIGLARLAYQHPRAYSRLTFPIFLLMLCGAGAWGGFVAGYEKGARDAISYASAGGELSRFAAKPFDLWISLTIAAVAVFLVSLLFVHRLRDD